jgi:hypothetical protein
MPNLISPSHRSENLSEQEVTEMAEKKTRLSLILSLFPLLPPVHVLICGFITFHSHLWSN